MFHRGKMRALCRPRLSERVDRQVKGLLTPLDQNPRTRCVCGNPTGLISTMITILTSDVNMSCLSDVGGVRNVKRIDVPPAGSGQRDPLQMAPVPAALPRSQRTGSIPPPACFESILFSRFRKSLKCSSRLSPASFALMLRLESGGEFCQTGRSAA